MSLCQYITLLHAQYVQYWSVFRNRDIDPLKVWLSEAPMGCLFASNNHKLYANRRRICIFLNAIKKKAKILISKAMALWSYLRYFGLTFTSILEVGNERITCKWHIITRHDALLKYTNDLNFLKIIAKILLKIFKAPSSENHNNLFYA